MVVPPRREGGSREALLWYLKGAYKKDKEELFGRACCNGTRGNVFRTKESRFKLDLRKTFFTMMVVKH